MKNLYLLFAFGIILLYSCSNSSDPSNNENRIEGIYPSFYIPNFTITDSLLKPVQYSSFKGSTVLIGVNVSSYSGSSEIYQKIKKAFESNMSKGVKVVELFGSNSIIEMKEYCKSNNVKWKVFLDSSAKVSANIRTTSDYGPFFILLDKNGQIIYRECLSNKIDSTLANLGRAADATISPTKKYGLYVGYMLPDTTLQSDTGEKIAISKYKGNYVLLDFWATWCGPCISEMPATKKLWDKYKSKKFKLIGMSLDYNIAEWKKYIADNNCNWVQLYYSDGWERRLYDIHYIPQAFLLDPTGKIIYKGYPSDLMIENILKRIN